MSNDQVVQKRQERQQVLQRLAQIYESVQDSGQQDQLAVQFLIEVLEEKIHARFFETRAKQLELYDRIDWSAREFAVTSQDLDMDQDLVHAYRRDMMGRELMRLGYKVRFYKRRWSILVMEVTIPI